MQRSGRSDSELLHLGRPAAEPAVGAARRAAPSPGGRVGRVGNVTIATTGRLVWVALELAAVDVAAVGLVVEDLAVMDVAAVDVAGAARPEKPDAAARAA